MKTIPLTQGYSAIVDDDDYPFLAGYKWHVSFSGGFKVKYAVRTNKKQIVRMHRQLLNVTDPTVQVDHVDRDGLNNCRTNLRIATAAQNAINRGPDAENKSGYKGVHRTNGKWKAQIGVGYRKIHGGYYDDPVAAAIAYDNLAKGYFGEYAVLNFPA
jgi:phosphotransferase system IIB component